MPIEIGSRVGYYLANKARLGVVISKNEDRAMVKFDNGNIIAANPDRLQLVNYWRDRLQEKNIDNLRTYPTQSTMLEIFTSRQAVVFGIAAVRAMWYWSNHNVFNSRLKEPELVVNNNRTVYGSYLSVRGKRPGRLLASTRNHNLYELFSTVLHEMIHQYTIEIQYKIDHDWEPQFEGVHGRTFRNWIPIVRQRTGVTISIKGNPANDVTVFDEGQETDEPTIKPYIFALVYYSNNWYGFSVKNDSELHELTIRVHQSFGSTVYAGISNLKRLHLELIPANRGKINWAKVKRVMPLPIAKLAVRTAKPIDGWDLPNTNKM